MPIPNKHNGYSADGRRLYPFGGDSPSSAPTSQTVTQTTIPEYARPYVENMLGQAYALTDMSNPANAYPTYSGQRTAQFTPLQQQAFAGAANLRPSSQNATATNLATQAGLRALNTSYQPNYYGNQYEGQGAYTPSEYGMQSVQAPNIQQFQMSGPADFGGASLNAAPTAQAAQFQGPRDVGIERVRAPSLRNLSMQAQTAEYNPNLQAFQMEQPRDVNGNPINYDQFEAATTGYDPAANLQQYQMGPAERVSTDKFTAPGTAQEYMSPYIQNVLDIQRREAVRADDISRQQRGAAAAKAGAFGGARQAIEEAEANRNLQYRLNDIEATGLQRAYENAQQQFTTDQARALQAATANQGAGLTVGQQNLAAQLGVQGLGTQASTQVQLANLSNEQQANVQNAANQLQASGMTADQALRAALANQGTQLNVGQQNLASRLGVQQLGAGIGAQMAQANLANRQQAALQNLSAQLQTQGLGAQTGLQAQQLNQQSGLQAQLANQQMGYNTGLQNAQMRQQAELANAALAGQFGLQQGSFQQQAGLQNQQMAFNTGAQNLQAALATQQLGAGQNLQAQLANQGMFLNTQQAQEAANQYAYNQQMLNAANTAQYGQAANQLYEQSRQYGAGLGLQGLQAALGASGQLTSTGQQNFAQQQAALNMQNQMGTQQQQQVQNILSQQYQDFLNQQRYPYQQLGYMSDILRGLPMSQTTQSMYQAPPNPISQIAGAGLAAYGMTRKAGGPIKESRSAGLSDLLMSKLD